MYANLICDLCGKTTFRGEYNTETHRIEWYCANCGETLGEMDSYWLKKEDVKNEKSND